MVLQLLRYSNSVCPSFQHVLLPAEHGVAGREAGDLEPARRQLPRLVIPTEPELLEVASAATAAATAAAS